MHVLYLLFRMSLVSPLLLVLFLPLGQYTNLVMTCLILLGHVTASDPLFRFPIIDGRGGKDVVAESEALPAPFPPEVSCGAIC